MPAEEADRIEIRDEGSEHLFRLARARRGEILLGERVIVYDGAGHIPMEEIFERTARDGRAFRLRTE